MAQTTGAAAVCMCRWNLEVSASSCQGNSGLNRVSLGCGVHRKFRDELFRA